MSHRLTLTLISVIRLGYILSSDRLQYMTTSVSERMRKMQLVRMYLDVIMLRRV